MIHLRKSLLTNSCTTTDGADGKTMICYICPIAPTTMCLRCITAMHSYSAYKLHSRESLGAGEEVEIYAPGVISTLA